MEIHQLRYFAKVAELGHFTRAAEACNVSQPSLSQQILKLEKELKRPLFERLGRKIRLTEAGRQFKGHVDQILRLLEEARASVTDDPDRGRLIVGCIPTIAPYFLPDVLMRFASRCPQAQVEVIEEPTAVLLKRSAQGEIDLAVLALPIQDAHLQLEPLFEEELLAVLPTQHSLASKKRVTLKELTHEPFVLLNEAHCLTNTTLSFCNRHTLSPLGTSQIHQLATVLELVRLGQGISLMPAMAARTDAHPDRVYRSIAGEKPTRTIAVGWNILRYQTQLFSQFLAILRDSASSTCPPLTTTHRV